MRFAWKKIGSSNKELPNYPPMRELRFVGEDLIGLTTSGFTRVFRDGVFKNAIDDINPQIGLQIFSNAWNGKLHAFGYDGRAFVLEQGKNWSWRKIAGAQKSWEKWPKGGFDPSRGIFVVWGPRTSKGFKDETWTFDGSKWLKVKKSKPEMADPLSNPNGLSGGAFNLLYDPLLECVVRVGIKEVSYFDGSTWRGVPFEKGEVLGDWEREMWTDPKTKTILSAQRHTRDANLVKLQFEKDRARATLLTKMPKVHSRGANDTGGNVLYDLSVFDDARRTLVVFNKDTGQRFEADLEPFL